MKGKIKIKKASYPELLIKLSETLVEIVNKEKEVSFQIGELAEQERIFKIIEKWRLKYFEPEDLDVFLKLKSLIKGKIITLNEVKK